MNPQNSQQALAQLQGAQSQAKNPADILNQQRQSLGVTGAQETLTGLRGAINNTTKLLKQVAPSVMGRTGSSLVTNAQATRQISNEQAPIAQNLSEQGTAYGQSSQDLAELQQRAAEAASGIYQGQQDKLSYAQNLYNTLYQREQAAEAARKAELDRQEQIRQFNEQLALSKRSAGGSGGGGGGFSLVGGSGASGGSASAGGGTPVDTPQTKAYNFVQNMKGKSNVDIVSDFNAARNWYQKTGDQTDLYKLQYYKQAFPDLFKNASWSSARMSY